MSIRIILLPIKLLTNQDIIIMQTCFSLHTRMKLLPHSRSKSNKEIHITYTNEQENRNNSLILY